MLGDVTAAVRPRQRLNYELGLKSQFLDRRATLNVAAYRIDWKDVQQSITDPVCGSLFFANFGEARSEGAEVEFSLRPIASLLFNASASYTHAKYTKIDDAFVGVVDVQPGDALSEVPEWKYAASGEYTFAIGDRRSGYVRADWQYVDSIPTGVTTRVERGSYDIVNASVGLLSALEVPLYVQNAGNTNGTLAIRRTHRGDRRRLRLADLHGAAHDRYARAHAVLNPAFALSNFGSSARATRSMSIAAQHEGYVFTPDADLLEIDRRRTAARAAARWPGLEPSVFPAARAGSRASIGW